jgi:LysR family cys regulon transcriptional activator
MTLKQLRYLLAVIEGEMNISSAARALYVSQAAVSKQIKLLEEELGVQLFLRQGKKVTAITQAGHEIRSIAEKMTRDAENIKRISKDVNEEAGGRMTIAATHTQTCYVLPDVIEKFLQRYPGVQIEIRQGTPTECAEWVASGKADVCISTEVMEEFRGIEILPYYEWHRCVITPTGHRLTRCRPLSLKAVAGYPIITYGAILDSDSKIRRAFAAENLKPAVLLTTQDSDVIKTYVRRGFGIGIISELAVREDNAKLKVLDASRLFEPSTAALGIRRGHYVGRHLAYFIKLCVPGIKS